MLTTKKNEKKICPSGAVVWVHVSSSLDRQGSGQTHQTDWVGGVPDQMT